MTIRRFHTKKCEFRRCSCGVLYLSRETKSKSARLYGHAAICWKCRGCGTIPKDGDSRRVQVYHVGRMNSELHF